MPAVRLPATLVGACVLAGMIVGCASTARRVDRDPRHDDLRGTWRDDASLAVYRERASRPAAALVFAPPIVQDAPPLELARDVRQPGAFFGYQESVAEYFYVRWDDRQVGGGAGGWGARGGWGAGGSRDRYERRAISEKTGVLYR